MKMCASQQTCEPTVHKLLSPGWMIHLWECKMSKLDEWVLGGGWGG